MKILSSSIVLNGKPEEAWKKLVNWEEWTRWDGGMENISFHGPVRLNSIGKLKLQGGPVVDLKVTSWVEGKSYTSEFSLLGTRFTFVHVLEPLEGSVRAVVEVESSGRTEFLVGNLLKIKLQKELPAWLITFKRQFEGESTSS